MLLYLGLPYCSSDRNSKSMLIIIYSRKSRKAFGSIVRLRGVYHSDISGYLFNAVALPHVLYPALLLWDLKIFDFSSICVCYFEYSKFLLGFPIYFSKTGLDVKFNIKEPLELARIKRENFIISLFMYNVFSFFSLEFKLYLIFCCCGCLCILFKYVDKPILH